MNREFERNDGGDAVERGAAEWVLRHDRGLTAAEQDEFSQWLAADPRHRTAWAEHRWGWDELDRLAGLQTSVHAVPDPDLLKPKRSRLIPFRLARRSPFMPAAAEVARWEGRPASSRRLLQLGLPLVAAAVVAVGFFLWQRAAPPRAESVTALPSAPPAFALIEQRELGDGSVVLLNRGAVLTETFTLAERRVTLERGEAHFKVAKDAARPFVVEAAGVAVRAVGTAFNVRLEAAAVDVLVTEGTVAVATEEREQRSEVRGQKSEVSGEGAEEAKRMADEKGGLAGAPVVATAGARLLTSGVVVSAGERVVVALAPSAPAPEVQPVSPAEIDARLAWQPRMLDFTNAPLAEIVAEFNRRNPLRLTLGDPRLQSLRLSATFRSDNVEGFVRLMVSDFGLRAERREREEIVLYRAK